MVNRNFVNILFVFCLVSSSLQVSHINFDFIDFNIDFKTKASSNEPVLESNKNDLITYKEEIKVIKPLDLNTIAQNDEILTTHAENIEEKQSVIKEDEIDSSINDLQTQNISELQSKIDDLQSKLTESELKVKAKDAIIAQYEKSIDSLINELKSLKNKLQ